MPHIVLSEEQTHTYHSAECPVQIRDNNGKVLGYLEPDFRPDTVEEAEARAKSYGPGVPSSEARAMLQALEAEWNRTGGFEEGYMKEFLSKWRAKRGR